MSSELQVDKLGFTPGNWQVEESWIYSNKGERLYRDKDFYKGHLVAESVFSKDDRRLISWAKLMLEALITIREEDCHFDGFGTIEGATGKTWDEIQEILYEYK